MSSAQFLRFTKADVREKAAEMPFIRSKSVLLKRLPGGHVCILCFRNSNIRGKKRQPEVR